MLCILRKNEAKGLDKRQLPFIFSSGNKGLYA